MGAGSLLGAGAGSSVPSSRLQEIDKIYQDNKDLSDAALLELMKEEWKRLSDIGAESVGGDVEGVNSAKVDETPAMRTARYKEWFVACGKFDKCSSEGNLNKAMSLYASAEGIDIDETDEDGWSALFHACGEGNLKIVEFLLENKATIDLRDPFQCTPLFWAAFNNRRDVVKALLLAGADDTIIGEPEDEPKQTPSLAARRNNNPGIADYIDAESQLRKADPGRIEAQKRGEMTANEFNSSLRKLFDQ